MSRIAFLLGLVLALAGPLLLCPAAFAQSDTGEIDVRIIDLADQAPLADVRTILLGAQTASSLTNASGTIKYTDVPIGIYRLRVQRRGYDGAATREFDVLPDRAVQVSIQLSKRIALSTSGTSPTSSTSNLKIIGTVIAHAPRVSITSIDINENSPIRRLSDSLTDALDKLAGVSVTTDTGDPSSALTVSLHNQDESQTSLTLDGIPLSAPGVGGNLRGIGSDLFSGSSVSFSPSAGGLAGGVNFRTLEPTEALQVRTAGSMGTFDRSNYSVAATGSIDSLGIVLQHTWRGSNSPLTFQDYEDQSGLTYPHGGESTALGDLVKLRYRLGDERTTVSVTGLSNNRDATSICARDVAILPCGIGPDNQTYGRYGMAYATVQSLVGDVQTMLSTYTNASTQTTDDINRFILDPDNAYLPTLDPSLAVNSTTTRGVAYSASIAEGKHTISLGGNTYAALSASNPLAGSQFEVPFTNAASSTTYRIADTIKSNDALTITPQFSLADTTGLGLSLLAGVGANWAPHAADSYVVSFNVGSSQPNLTFNPSFSDPNAARFDCQAGTAVVNGPGDSGTGNHQSAAILNAGWAHQFNGGASLTLNAFSQVQSGQLINALIEEPLTFYPAGFLSTLDAAYQAPSVCGAAAPAPTIFAQESVAGTRRVYQGFDVNGRFALSRYITVLPTYSLNLATLTAASARLGDGPTTTIVGAQLPNRPMHRAGITFDGLLPRSGIETLANAQYTGANNSQNLGPYVNVSFGVSHKFGPGQLTLFENNAFNVYGGDFASDTFAQPLLLSDGLPYHTTATPLTPRSIFLSYSAVLGGPAPGPAFNQFARGIHTAQLTPQATPTPPSRRERFTSYPPPLGVDPLSLASARPSCDATAQAAAQPVFVALRAYVHSYESGATPAPVPNFTLVAHKVTSDPAVPYYLEIRPAFRPRTAPRTPEPGGLGGPPQEPGGPIIAQSRPERNTAATTQRRAFASSPEFRAYRGFIACTYITLLSADDAHAKGIVLENGRPGLVYIPHLGLAFVQALQLPAGGGSLKRR